MSEEIRLTSRSSGQLLARILDQPNLVAAVQSLPAQALGKLINHVGLEDAGEIVALATTAQLERIFDDDLWHSPSPGKDETFEADRFALWLEVMLEAGESFAASKLAELPEDLVTLAFHKQVLVINIEEMAIAMSERASWGPADEDVQLEKALESCLAEELDEYRIISRCHESWDTLFGLLVALDRDHHAFLQRLLERLCALDAEVIEDNGGLFQVLTAEESLASDVGADREDRRAQEGYIAPSSAASFLALARMTKLEDVLASTERDPVTRAYFRQLGNEGAKQGANQTRRPPAASDATATSATPPSDATSLLVILRDADVLPPARAGLLEAGSAGNAAPEADLFTTALRELGNLAPEVHATRVRELAYLANVLTAGCSLAGRAMRPVEAARAAVTTCNLGLQRQLATGAQASPTLALENTPADKLFRMGWTILFHDVVQAAAAATELVLTRAIRAASRDQAAPLERAASALRSATATGKPCTAVKRLHCLEKHLGRPRLVALSALLDECPTLAGELGPQRDHADHDADSDAHFIATDLQIGAVRAFLERRLTC